VNDKILRQTDYHTATPENIHGCDGIGYLDKTSTRGREVGLAGVWEISGKAGSVSEKEFVGGKQVTEVG
jgi:hypothetical protein